MTRRDSALGPSPETDIDAGAVWFYMLVLALLQVLPCAVAKNHIIYPTNDSVPRSAGEEGGLRHNVQERQHRTHTRSNTHTGTRPHARALTHTLTHTHARASASRTRERVHTHAHTHTYTHTHTHTHTHARTRAHTHAD